MRRPGLVCVVAVWLVAAGNVTQAVLAGQGWFVDQSLFGLHGGIGHGVLLVAVVAAAISRRAAPRWVAVLGTLIVLGLVAQTGVGYAGRRVGLAAASAAHVPLGVALLGSAVAAAMGVTLARRADPLRQMGDAERERNDLSNGHSSAP